MFLRMAIAVLGTGLIAAAGAGLFAVLRSPDTHLALEQGLAAAGFGIDEVVVTGHRFTTDTDVFDSLDLGHVRTLTALDAAAVQARLQRLPWVDTAAVVRTYPGRVLVTISERRPHAVWLRGEGAEFVDVTGRPLMAVRADALPELPRIAGEGAPVEAAALYEMLGPFPAIAQRVQVAHRVSGRRWRLELAGGVRLELPADGAAAALDALMRSDEGKSALDGGAWVIDLTSRGSIAIRAAGGG